ncbi:hypothetical protein [Streptomyces poonensis]|uniref:Secreted protein n=1 Tax=Streptomyces poonensis TaxID=68255 RepID=A0A918UE59_9ACTN|nr:hypothetical protein [Streptomyces poonensis]GGY99315.1 hypothetical protein GCM10010365_17500 [Streptomyces poonensis]
MRRPACVLIAAVAASLLSALPARAGSAPPDVTVQQCHEGGGLAVVSMRGKGANATFARYCTGGTHDGQNIV